MKSETKAEQLFCLGYGSAFIPLSQSSPLRGSVSARNGLRCAFAAGIKRANSL